MRGLSSSFVLLSLAVFGSTAPTKCVKREPRPISVASVTELGPIKQNDHVKGRDNGQSVAFDGKSYWFFDDTLMPDAFIANTAAVTSNLDASNNIDLTSSDWTRSDNGTKPTLTIPYTEDELAFQAAHDKANGCTGETDEFCGAQFALWPGAVLADPERGRILVGYGKLCRGSDGARCKSTELAGENLGWGWFAAYPGFGLGGRMSPSSGGKMDVTSNTDPALFGGPDDFMYTTAAVTHDGYAYLYGAASIMEGSKVARVPLDSFEDQLKWAYWDGTSYQSDVNAGKGIMGPGAAGNTVFHSEALGGFYNVYCPFGSNTIYAQSAPAPEGPWSESVVLFDSVPEGDAVNYACFAHPEFSSADGLDVYVSYYQTGSGAQRLTKVQLQ